MHDADHFGPRMREERLARGWTREALAARLAKATPKAVENWEQGRRHPSLRRAVEIARTLGVGLEALLAPPTSERPGRGRPKGPDGE